MNNKEITLKVKDSNNGFTISNDINYQTGKVIINEIEITDIETWNKAISKQLELQQENKQLKDNWNKLKNIAKSQSDFKLKCHNESLWFEVDELLNKMQELENGENNE